MEKKKTRGILRKVLIVFAAIMVALTAVLITLSVITTQNTARDTVLEMAFAKMNGDINSATTYLNNAYGGLRLVGGTLVDADGTPIESSFDTIDRISADLGVVATVFVRDGRDFRRIVTSIRDAAGSRVTGTFLGAASAAFAPVTEGRRFIGEASILGAQYVTGYQPLFGENRSVIGILFIGIEMTEVDGLIAAGVGRAVAALVAGALLTLVGALVITAFMIVRVISNPITATAAIAEVLAGGDLTVAVPEGYLKRRDEIGMLARSFEAMTKRLSETVQGINLSATQVAAGSQQMSSTAQQMSQGATEQAAAAEEVSSSMEEMGSNIRQNADNAAQTESIAKKSA
ncbi:MAG: methyl-accepting chemotaxis protein, partial [Spirochaetaceae bacterium]